MGSKTGKQGRPPKYTGKVNNDNIDTEYFKLISLDHESIVYAAVVNSKALKRNILLVHVTYLKESGKDARKLYFSTDVSMDPNDVLLYYRSRFQIEFLYRDGKQHTGMNHNILMLNRFFDVFCISPYSTKNQNYIKELILYGTMAA